jgi:hypothetical protein
VSRCTYPVRVTRSWLFRVTGGRHEYARSCGQPGAWRVRMWARPPFTRLPDFEAIRCARHKASDVQERMLSQHIRETLL